MIALIMEMLGQPALNFRPRNVPSARIEHTRSGWRIYFAFLKQALRKYRWLNRQKPSANEA